MAWEDGVGVVCGSCSTPQKYCKTWPCNCRTRQTPEDRTALAKALEATKDWGLTDFEAMLLANHTIRDNVAKWLVDLEKDRYSRGWGELPECEKDDARCLADQVLAVINGRPIRS
jgi:hypothetical protein